MEKILIGQGWEHRVYRLPQYPEWVFKVPTKQQRLFLALFLFDAKIIEQEYREAEHILDNSRVKIPQSTFFYYRDKHKYLIKQQFIQEDDSISDPRQFMIDNHLHHLIEHYDRSSLNFLSNQEFLYWVDPTLGGSVSGFLARRGILSRHKSRQIKLLLTRINKITSGND